MATVPRLLSYEEWLAMPPVEDGTDEVVHGELRFMPPTRYPHADIIQRLVSRFTKQLDEQQVSILGSNFGLMITREPLTCRSPDMGLYWRKNRRVVDGLEWSPPDLLIEVLSPSENKRRKREKLEDYAAIGVPEVWIVSPQAESVEVRLLDGGTLGLDRIVAEGIIEPTRFPGVKMPVVELWPE